jgi:hypothetical protein
VEEEAQRLEAQRLEAQRLEAGAAGTMSKPNVQWTCPAVGMSWSLYPLIVAVLHAYALLVAALQLNP